MLPGREGWWFADPLLCHRGGKRCCLPGDGPFHRQGRLEVCELHDDGSIDGWRVALEEDFHLSFPMVFDWNGEVWMIPRPGTTTACGFTAAGCSYKMGTGPAVCHR